MITINIIDTVAITDGEVKSNRYVAVKIAADITEYYTNRIKTEITNSSVFKRSRQDRNILESTVRGILIAEDPDGFLGIKNLPIMIYVNQPSN